MASDLIFSLPRLVVDLGVPETASISVSLPSLTAVVGAKNPNNRIVAHLPPPTGSFHALNQELAQIKINLGWPHLGVPTALLRGGGLMAFDLPVLNRKDHFDYVPFVSSGHFISDSPFIRIKGNLPKITAASLAHHDNLGHISFKLPGIHKSIHVLSEIKGRITIALPLPDYYGHIFVGSVGRINTEIPMAICDAVLLSSGLIQLDITLPCLITDSSGFMEEASVSYKTIVMNTENFGVTEYGDLQLHGMVDVFGNTIALNSNQIVKMGHTLDNTEHIDASFQTGTLDFSNPYWMKPRDFWIHLRSGKKLKLTIKDNEVPVNESTYLSENFVENLQKTRVKVGRGLYAEFFDVKIENIDGELVEIKNIHIYTDPVHGRKR